MTTRFARATDVLERQCSDCVVLLPLRSDEPFMLSGSGGLVWRLLAEPTTLEDLSHVLSEATGAPEPTVTADLEPVLRDLVERGAVEEVA